ncbi:MAG: ABC transporter ATP-binding protein [Pseudomonadota bacterium]
MLEISNVSKYVQTQEGRLDILQNVSVDVKKGETIAIVGASGSGKSTLLGLMAGLDLPSEGKIKIANHSLTELDEDGRAKLRAEHVGFVFQSFQLLPSLSALENVQLPLDIQDKPQNYLEPSALLERVGLSERKHHLPSQLSGGEQQRVAIARAFVTQPTVLFADEPTGNLDSITGAKIIDLLFELNKEHNTTLVLVTHDQKLADRCARRIVIESGQVLREES